FHRHLQLARRARRFVSKFLPPRSVVPVVDLSRNAFRVLELVHWISQTQNVRYVVAKLACRSSSGGGVDHPRMDPRLALQRFWMERARRRTSSKLAPHSSFRVHRRCRDLVRARIRKHHCRHHTASIVCRSENSSNAAAFRSHPHADRNGRLVRVRAASHPKSVADQRSEEHTSELQSPYDLVCRLLLEKK